MDSEHYFSSSPGSELKLRTIPVRIAGSDRQVVTAGGVFSPDRIDTGTSVLLANASAPPPGGNLLDLGCGWGPIALTLALTSPHATVWAVDVNERALDLVRANAERMSIPNIKAVLPSDIPDTVRFTTIWSNPPIRVGKHELHGLLERWLPRLEPGSDAWLVVQRNLGSDSLHRWLQGRFPEDFTVVRAATNKGYRVLRVRRRTGTTVPIDILDPSTSE
jgi:16S rRNA G1207 methylase RsmC